MSGGLPNSALAWVEKKKIVQYLLSPTHAEGGPKAQFFVGRGFTVSNWEEMADALCHHARSNDISRAKTTPFAVNYSLDCNVPTPDRSNPCIRTVWEIRPEDPRPRLITAHPLG